MMLAPALSSRSDGVVATALPCGRMRAGINDGGDGVAERMGGGVGVVRGGAPWRTE